MNRKYLVLIAGVLTICISSYNAISGETIKSNLVGLIIGIGLTLSYFTLNKSKKLR